MALPNPLFRETLGHLYALRVLIIERTMLFELPFTQVNPPLWVPGGLLFPSGNRAQIPEGV